jgi:hypothetical protein
MIHERFIIRRILTDVSEVYVASLISVEEWAKQQTGRKVGGNFFSETAVEF